MAASHHLRGRLALLALVAGGTACTSSGPPPPLAEPADLASSFDHFAGTLLSGPLGADVVAHVPTEPAQALRLKASVLLVDSMARFDELAAAHAADIVPLADELGLVANLGATDAIDATSRLCVGGSLARRGSARGLFDALAAGAPARARLLAQRDDVVLPAASTVLAVAGAAGSRLTVAVHGIGEGRADVTLDYETADRGGEILKLANDLVAGDDPTLLVVPAPFRFATDRAVAVLLEVDAAPPSGELADRHAEEVAAAFVRIGHAAEDVAKATSRAAARANKSSAIASALRGLTADPNSRAALVYLASSSNAELLGDVALVASEEELARLLGSLCADRAKMLEQEADAERLGWSLERAAWRFLAETAQESELAPELSALLYLHAGAVGAWPATLEDLTETSADAADFTARLTEENLRLLDDHSAAVRVRAFDWLAARHAAPAGFEPLAPIAERRRILASREHAGE
jgi:hypothetical protein